jgi:hypothetical protein
MDRARLFAMLDDYCHERHVELGDRRLKNPILKSYLVETSRYAVSPIARFEALASLSKLDDQIYVLTDREGEIGWLETRDRFLIPYTFLKTNVVVQMQQE